jgi:hypothetical protein
MAAVEFGFWSKKKAQSWNGGGWRVTGVRRIRIGRKHSGQVVVKLAGAFPFFDKEATTC